MWYLCRRTHLRSQLCRDLHAATHSSACDARRPPPGAEVFPKHGAEVEAGIHLAGGFLSDLLSGYQMGRGLASMSARGESDWNADRVGGTRDVKTMSEVDGNGCVRRKANGTAIR